VSWSVNAWGFQRSLWDTRLARQTNAVNSKDTAASAKLLLIQKASTEGRAVQWISPFNVLCS
jgi:hypothetical protein